MEIKELWQQKTDEEIAAAAESLSDFTEDAQRVILSEMSRRGLTEPPEKQESIQPSAPPGSDSAGLRMITGPVGIRGWLLLFFLILTVFTPLIKIAAISIAYNEISSLFDRFPRLHIVALLNTVLGLGIIIFSIYAGVCLWQKKQNAVGTAKRYLVSYLAYTFITSCSYFLAGLPGQAYAEMFSQVFLNLFGAACLVGIWYTYLEKSQRVKNTFLS